MDHLIGSIKAYMNPYTYGHCELKSDFTEVSDFGRAALHTDTRATEADAMPITPKYWGPTPVAP